MPPLQKFPQILREGSVSVKIYRTPVKGGYDAFTLGYYEGGKRCRIVRASYSEVKDEALRVLRELSNGQAPSQQLRGEDREAYVAAVAKLKELGVSLGEAVQEYTNARRALSGQSSVAEAVRFFKAHSSYQLDEKTVAEAYELYLTDIKDRISSRSLETTKLHVGRFAQSFHCPLMDVTHEQIQSWLNQLGYSGRYFNNARGFLITFFRWCRKRRFLPDLETEAEKVVKCREKLESTAIFEPEIMERILDKIDPCLVPYLVLSAFGGLRPSEARRLEWADISWDEGYIEIKVTTAQKTLRDRFVPLHPNLRAWLEPAKQAAGPVVALKRPHEMLTKRWKSLKFLQSWPPDVLRHSYGSYRLALLADKQRLAEEMGNSPQIIVKNYRRPVSKTKAEAWFEIRPRSKSR